ncbi:MAG: CCA-adding enzyme [Candidatus Diapherotrites archaeon ADurb.Bin253]|nr:MAG: CCA-adding enzyme [Candidatus Diapherotrites archaeon ADurb.Bin253]
MKTKRVKKILKEITEKIRPPEEDLKRIKKGVDSFCKEIKSNIKKYKIDAEIFVGGSFAKKTVIKKDRYDVDVFIRYDKKYKNTEISDITRKLIDKSRTISVVHGSRDYFRVDCSEDFFIELIPVRKIKNPKEHENITDLSYLHVKYINRRVKKKNILDEIKIAKAFCYANRCYGAESYIHGFSGYSLELLVYYYKGFEKFINAMAKLNIKKEKLIIDIEKQFKNKKDVLMDLNSSKLNSPIILIDPTYKQRNVLAALSKETFEMFQKSCKEFLENPSINKFELKTIDFNKVRQYSIKRGKDFIRIKTSTSKPEGDVAGSKLLKFYEYLTKEISRFFIVKKRGFEYSNKDYADSFFIAEEKKEIIYPGPYLKDKKNCDNFRKEHKEVYEKAGRLYAKEKINFNLKGFLDKWKTKNTKIINEMYIKEFNYI